MKRSLVGIVAIAGVLFSLSGCAAPKTTTVPTPPPSAKVDDGTVVTRYMSKTAPVDVSNTFILPAQGFRIKASCTQDNSSGDSKLSLSVFFDNTATAADRILTVSCNGKAVVLPVKDIPTARGGREGAVNIDPSSPDVTGVNLVVTAGL